MTQPDINLEGRLQEDLEKSLNMLRNANNIDARIFADKRLKNAYHNITKADVSEEYKRRQYIKIAEFYLDRGLLGCLPPVGSVFGLAHYLIDERRGISNLGDVFRHVLYGYDWIRKYIERARTLRAVGGEENHEKAKQFLLNAWNLAVIMKDKKYQKLIQFIEWEA